MDDIRRFERKYIISPQTALQMAATLPGYCALDDNHIEGGYTIHSLYFETPGLDFYFDKTNRVMDRSKPRVRFYGHTPGKRVWVEVKRKVNGVVIKSRRPIDTAHWPGVWQGEPDAAPSTAHLDDFLGLVLRTGAEPTVHVRYKREAWVGQIDDYARVTFDRHMESAHAHGSPSLTVPDDAWVSFDDPDICKFEGSPVVLELKCENKVPIWMSDLVHRYGLTESSFSKYCNGLIRSTGHTPALRRTGWGV